MLTKDEEREALKKIEKILAQLKEKAGDDANSYILTAFAGVVEDARENIENDFANSWRDRAQTAQTLLQKQTAELEKARGTLEAIKAHALPEKAAREAAYICHTYATDREIRASKDREKALTLDPEKDAAQIIDALNAMHAREEMAQNAHKIAEALEKQAALAFFQR